MAELVMKIDVLLVSDLKVHHAIWYEHHCGSISIELLQPYHIVQAIFWPVILHSDICTAASAMHRQASLAAVEVHRQD